MTRVREAFKQAALVDEEVGESSSLAVANGSGGASPPLLHASQRSDAAPLLSFRPELADYADGIAVQTDGPVRRPAPAFASRSLDAKLVVSAQAAPTTVQEYRQVAAALQEIQDRSEWTGRSGLHQSFRAVLVTSALPGEGKTLTVANLALTLSDHLAKHVLVIDADLRRPAVHELLGLSNATGLSDVLRSGTDNLPLQEVSPLLSVLSAGASWVDPQTLGSDRMRTVLEECARRFEWVLVDAPAISFGTDARLLARLSRAVLLVIATGATSSRIVERALSEVGRACVIGTVLNQVAET